MDTNKNQEVQKLSQGAMRQAAYVARMRKDGYNQRTFWLNSAESQAVDNLLAQMRVGQETTARK